MTLRLSACCLKLSLSALDKLSVRDRKYTHSFSQLSHRQATLTQIHLVPLSFTWLPTGVAASRIVLTFAKYRCRDFVVVLPLPLFTSATVEP